MPDNNILEEDYLNDLLKAMEEGDDFKEEINEDLSLSEENANDITGGIPMDVQNVLLEELLDSIDDSIDFNEDDDYNNIEPIEEILQEDTRLEQEDSSNQLDAGTEKEKKKKNPILLMFKKFTKAKKEVKDSDEEVKNEKEEIIEEEQEQEVKKPKKNKTEKPKKEKKPKKIKEPNKEFNEKIEFSFKGVILALTLIILIFLTITIGGERINYSQKMNLATDYYLEKNYKEAYFQISGIDLKKSDEDFYQQLRLIMYVSKQYDSYGHFKLMGENEKALDSLIKGVEGYDSYIEQANELGVDEDFQYLIGLITSNLQEDYGLSEKEVRDLAKIKNRQEYSKKIYSIVKSLG